MFMNCFPINLVSGASTPRGKQKSLYANQADLDDNNVFDTNNDQSFSGSQSARGSQQSSISAVRLQIRLNEVNNFRKITLKGLYGSNSLIKSFIDQFKKKLNELLQKQAGPNGG